MLMGELGFEGNDSIPEGGFYPNIFDNNGQPMDTMTSIPEDDIYRIIQRAPIYPEKYGGIDENGDEISYDEDVVSTQKGTAEDMVRIVADNGGEASLPVIENTPPLDSYQG